MSASSKTVDFSGVKDGGGRFSKRRVAFGDYAAKITKVEDAKAKDDVDQYLFTIQLVKHPTATYPYYCKLQENQLWKLRNLFIAAGKTVPKKKVKVNPNELVGKLIGVTMEDTEYNDKEQSEVAAVFPAADLADGTPTDDDDTDDEHDAPDDDEDLDIDEPEEEADEDEDEAEEADPYASMDRAELKAELKKRDPEFVAKKSQSDDDLRDLLRADSSDDEAEEEEDDEEEEEPAPAPKKAAAKKTKKKKVSADVSDDELEELDIDDI